MKQLNSHNWKIVDFELHDRKTCAYVLLIAVLLCLSCTQKRGASVHIVVPDGFKGLVKIVKDQTGMEIELEHGEYIYRIPTNGMLKVKEPRGLSQWHYTEASYSSGKPLPVRPENSSGDIALFGVGSDSLGRTFFFVGTDEEKEIAMKDSYNLLR
jgi:hypothetical protein